MGEQLGYVAVHGQGLGHATRAVALARGLLDARPELALLFLAGSPALDLVVASGYDAMPLPPVPDWPSRDGALGPVWRWYAGYARYLRVTRAFLRKEADWSRYRFLISDGELASVREAVRHAVPTALVLNETRHAFARDRASRVLEAVGNAWFARLARRVDLLLTTGPAPDWPNARRIGSIVRPFSRTRDELREDFVFRKRTILVTGGGTGIGGFLLDRAVRAFQDLRLDDASMVVVSGPRLKVSSAPGVYAYGFIPNLHDMVLAADLVITTAGQSTVNEAQAAGTPIIAIPPKGHAEQEANARELGYVHEDIGRLRELIPEKLAAGRPPPRPADNARAIGYLQEFLDDVGSVSGKPL
ncbi:MAG: glycosyltransferase [Methanobacteriota archaeon]